MLSMAIFILANLVIFSSYITIAYFVVPSLNITYRSTKLGGFFFFLTCGLTHLDLTIHAITRETLAPSDYTSWHMMLIHVPQAIAVVTFTYGLYKEIGRKSGSFVLKSYHNVIKQLVEEMSALRPYMSYEDVKLLNEAIANVQSIQDRIDTSDIIK